MDSFTSNGTVVGLLAATTYWRVMIRNILPQGSNGIHVVFKASCSPAFTYQLHGPDVKYLGVGDHHERKHNKLGKQASLASLLTNVDSVYTGTSLDDNKCQFTLHVYPSDAMKKTHTSIIPIAFTVCVVFIFAFTSAEFYFYDVTVERRQKTVMNTAVRSTAIVSSLFPSEVRDRLYPLSEMKPSLMIQRNLKGNNEPESENVSIAGSIAGDDSSIC